MPFAFDDFHDLVRLLEEHPQWRADLRRLVLSDELLELPALVGRLAAAQEQAEGRLARLEAAVERLVARVEELAAAQEQAEGRLARLEAAVERLVARVEELAAAQARTAEQLLALTARVDDLGAQMAALAARVDELTVRVGEGFARTDAQFRGLRREVGALSEGVGARAELDAERVLLRLFRRRGYRLLERPHPLAVDGEVDMATRVIDPAGQTFSVLVEAKFRLQRGDVTGWQRRLQDPAFLARLGTEGLQPPFLVYAFGLRVYPGAERAGQEVGIGVLDAEGEVVAAVPRQA